MRIRRALVVACYYLGVLEVIPLLRFWICLWVDMGHIAIVVVVRRPLTCGIDKKVILRPMVIEHFLKIIDIRVSRRIPFQAWLSFGIAIPFILRIRTGEIGDGGKNRGRRAEMSHNNRKKGLGEK